MAPTGKGERNGERGHRRGQAIRLERRQRRLCEIPGYLSARFLSISAGAGHRQKGTASAGPGTGTGVRPAALYPYGAKFVGVDSAEGQIAQARALAERAGMEIDFLCLPAEGIRFAAGSFDGATACQCLMYFDHAALAPRLAAF